MQQTLENPPTLTVTAESRAQRDEGLDAAVLSLRTAAIKLRAGILVTRKSHRKFTVAVSPLVPFGLIRELDKAS